ncbi:MAG: helix-turn-helix transcriptional regulator [Rhodobiaceae bacterium]|nr:helix-turn-helix transcriptional regulator [Rhodobiaceae bacterium]MCC0055896.1 helix-turn-helix transcriptional regulator [Rhodobiaceae bacterium]
MSKNVKAKTAQPLSTEEKLEKMIFGEVHTPGGEDLVVVRRQALEAALIEATENARRLPAHLDAANSDDPFMAEDVAAYDRAKERGGPVLTQDQMNRIIAGESTLRVWREAAGKTQGQLAADAGVSQSYIADLEAGRKEGGIQLWRRIADALGCDLDDLA